MTPERLAHRPISVSPGEAARLIGLGRTKLYEALGTGALPSFRIGTRRLIRVADLESWLDRHGVEAGGERREPGA